MGLNVHQEDEVTYSHIIHGVVMISLRRFDVIVILYQSTVILQMFLNQMLKA